MKRFVLLLLALCLLTCTCVSYSGYIFSRQGILSTNQTAPNTGGYPPGQGPPNTGGYPPGQGSPPGDGSGYPPGVLQPDGSGNSPVVPPPGRVLGRTGVQPPPITAGYPPGQGSPNTGGYPPGSQLPNTGGYPPGSQLPNTGGYPPGSQLPNTGGYPHSNLPITHGCQNNKYNEEPGVFVGTDPAPGGAAASGGKIRVWINDEGAPKLAPNEKVDPVTGQITPGDRTALDGRGKGYYRWEPALYITPLTSANQNGPFSNDAENGGKPYFPSLIKGDYNPDVTVQDKRKGSGLQGPPVDADYTRFENGIGGGGGGGRGKGIGGLPERFTAEDIWDVNSLGLAPGPYHVELVIHDGDHDLGIDCVALNIGGTAQVVPPPGTSGYPQRVPPGTSGYHPSNLPTTHGCQNNANNDEPEIFVGTDPAPGGAAASGGKIRVWVNDEGAPKIAPNEKVDPVTGQITPGDRTALDGRGKGYYRWEPALYITPLTSANQSGPFGNDAENGGKPYFPSLIKGDYNPNVKGDKGSGLKGPPIDGDYTQFENGPTSSGGKGKGGGEGKGGGGLSEKYTAEYIWDVNALGLPPGAYHVQMVIHDGDDNLGIDCVALNI